MTTDPGLSAWPSMVWTGSEHAMAWMDDRDGNREIYFARVSAEGALVGPAVRVTDAAGTSGDPSLAWNGHELGLAFTDERTGTFQIYFARLAPDGTVLAPEVQVSTATEWADKPSLVWTGEAYGLAWSDDRNLGSGNDQEVYFARITEAGLVDGREVRVTSSTSRAGQPSLAWNGAGFGLAYASCRASCTVLFYPLNTTGTVAGPSTVVYDDVDANVPRIAWSGTDYGVTFRYEAISGLHATGFQRLAADGTRLGTSLELALFAAYGDYPGGVSWDHGGWTVAYQDQLGGLPDGLYVVRLLADGTLDGTPHRASDPTGFARAATLACSDRGCAAAWHQDVAEDFDIYFARVGGCE